MTAMNNASDNAKELAKSLSLSYKQGPSGGHYPGNPGGGFGSQCSVITCLSLPGKLNRIVRELA